VGVLSGPRRSGTKPASSSPRSSGFAGPGRRRLLEVRIEPGPSVDQGRSRLGLPRDLRHSFEWELHSTFLTLCGSIVTWRWARGGGRERLKVPTG